MPGACVLSELMREMAMTAIRYPESAVSTPRFEASDTI